MPKQQTRGARPARHPQPAPLTAPKRLGPKPAGKARVRAAGLMEPVRTREDWLSRGVSLLHPLVRQVAAWQSVPCRCCAPPAIACSWPPGRRTSALSHSLQREEGLWEISVSPRLGQGQLRQGLPEAVEHTVLAFILHELCHCVIGSDKHQFAFPRLAAAVGLTAPWARPALSGPMQSQVATQVLSRIGRYPHESLSAPERGAGGNRQRKLVCEHCGRIIRAAGDLQARHLCDDGRVGDFVSV